MKNAGLGIAPILGLIFITFKLMGYITWSWIWVLSPFWIPLGSLVLILAVVGVLVAYASDE